MGKGNNVEMESLSAEQPPRSSERWLCRGSMMVEGRLGRSLALPQEPRPPGRASPSRRRLALPDGGSAGASPSRRSLALPKAPRPPGRRLGRSLALPKAPRPPEGASPSRRRLALPKAPRPPGRASPSRTRLALPDAPRRRAHAAFRRLPCGLCAQAAFSSRGGRKMSDGRKNGQVAAPSTTKLPWRNARLCMPSSQQSKRSTSQVGGTGMGVAGCWGSMRQVGSSGWQRPVAGAA